MWNSILTARIWHRHFTTLPKPNRKTATPDGRQVLLVRGQNRVLFRWTLQGPEKNHGRLPRLSLRLRPLLAYRGFHELTSANGHISPHTSSTSRVRRTSPTR